MLLEFTVGNFLSFKDRKTFTMKPGAISELKSNIAKEGKHKLLKSAVIYGANSSGKSNFVKALEFMISTIKNSSKINSTDKLNVKPFLLCSENEQAPSYFEILYIRKNVRYRYGFELDNEKIHSEWLFVLQPEKKKEDIYFIRNLEGIGINDIFDEAKGLEGKTRDNGLFLPVADQFNSQIAKSLLWFFNNSINVISGIKHEKNIASTDVLYTMDNYKSSIESFIKKLDLGFRTFSLDEDTSKPFRKRVNTIHNRYDAKGNLISNIEFKMHEHESAGTNKIFDLAGEIVLTLEYGLTLIVDELDSKLHPILTKEIIKLFNNEEFNKDNAQLIFTTHDTNLLSANLFRRDQIWFTEKDECESTDLYSLLEFKDYDGKTIRKDRSFEKDYINGRYGGIPFISNFQEN